MKRAVIGFIWVWGLWSAGSALEFLRILPAWPFLILGLAAAAFVVVPRQRREAARQPLATPEAQPR